MDLRTAGLVVGWFGVAGSIVGFIASLTTLSFPDVAIEIITKIRLGSSKHEIEKGTNLTQRLVDRS